MYPVSNAVKALFEAEQRQVLRITGEDKNGTVITITEANVIDGSFSIDRYSCNGDKLEIGTAIAAQMTLKLDNRNGEYNGVIFEGTELFVEIGIADWTQSDPVVNWIPCGYFTPDEQPRSLSTITINALDRMTMFDSMPPLLIAWTDNKGNLMTTNTGETIHFTDDLDVPCTVANLIEQIATWCKVPFTQSLTSFPNYNYVITAMPVLQSRPTFRNLIQWCAGIMGCNAWIDWNGELKFSWYDNESGYVNTIANRFNSDLYENPIVITGVQFKDTDDAQTVYLAGLDSYTLDLSGNYFVNSNNAATILQNIYSAVHDFAYTPFSATTINAPYLWPMDRMVFTDKDSNGHVSLLTNVNSGINSNTVMSAVGVTAKVSDYAPLSPFTKQQSEAMETIKRVNQGMVSEAVNRATEMITGGLGGYVVLKSNETTGQTEEILIMDTPDINTAINVWRFNSGGLAHSSNGYEGPYSLAMTMDGQIVANMITAGELNADIIKSGIIDGDLVMAKLFRILNDSGEIVAQFNDTIRLGLLEKAYALIDFNSFMLFDRNDIKYMDLGDNRNERGISTVENVFKTDGQTTEFYLYGYTPQRSGLDPVQKVIINRQETTRYNYIGYNAGHEKIVMDYAPQIGQTLRVLFLTEDPQYHYDFGTRNKDALTGNYSFVNGQELAASGIRSHAEGYGTIAANTNAHAEGYKSEANGGSSHAEGYQTNANGTGSHAEGYKTNAEEQYSHAEGDSCVASGKGSHSEGHLCEAIGRYSHAEGTGTEARESCSHAEGNGTVAAAIYQHVSGVFNVINDGYSASHPTLLEIVGNGYVDSSEHRSNARTLNYNGNEWIAGTLTQASDSRLKEEIGEVPDVSSIRARRFKWNDNKIAHDDKEHIGYFAQDVEEIAPYLVDMDDNGYKSLDYIALLCAKVDALERKVAELEKGVK